MRASDPAPAPKRVDRKVCRHCEATPAACRSWHWLRGNYCCTTCSGNHDEETEHE